MPNKREDAQLIKVLFTQRGMIIKEWNDSGKRKMKSFALFKSQNQWDLATDRVYHKIMVDKPHWNICILKPLTTQLKTRFDGLYI